MAGAGQVAPEDPRRRRAAANLTANLEEIADFCRKRQIPLMLCTLAGNLSGFAPAADEPPLEPRQLKKWRDTIEKAESLASTASGAERGLALLDETAREGAASARQQFVRGRLLQQLGRDAAAREAFTRARDRDRVPFRAPAAFNRVIREVAAAKGCLLADVEAAFERASPGGSPGWSLIADHLHPTAAGQILLARTLVQALAGPGSPRPVSAEALQRLRPAGEYRSMLGDSPLEQLRVCQAMARLLSEPPLDRGHRGRVAGLVADGQALWKSMLPAERAAWERRRSLQPGEPLALSGADHLFAAGNPAAARPYYRASRLERPFTVRGDLWATLRWARCAQLRGPLAPADVEAVEAAEWRARFLAAAPGANQAFFTFFKGYARHLAGDGEQALAHLEKAAADAGIRRTFHHDLLWLLCEGLADRGRFAEAETWVRRISAEVGQEQPGRQLQGWLAERRNRVESAE